MFGHKFLQNASLKTSILIPLSLALVGLLGMFVFNVYQTHHDRIIENFEKRLVSVQQLFEKELYSDTKLLDLAIKMLLENPEIQAAWLAKDREALQQAASPILADLKSKYRITHLYFHDDQKINFLRVHSPEKYGDDLGCLIPTLAEESNQRFPAIELRPSGILILRVVHPWKINGKLVGYIEMAEDIEHIIEKIHAVLGTEIYVAVYKNHLERKQWEAGRQKLGLEAGWDQFPSSVIVSKTLDKTSKALAHILSEEHHEPMGVATGIELFLDKRRYKVGFVPIDDMEGHEVGDMVVLYDVTKQIAASRNSVLTISVICIAVGLGLFFLFSIILGLVEEELAEHRHNLEDLVDERTIELTEANQHLKQEITRRELLEAKLHDISVTDELTGLLNRRGFFVMADKQLKIAERMKNELFLLFADIDDLKLINDHQGHNIGDQALVEVADFLKNTFRKADVISRLGGDEFVVLLNSLNWSGEDFVIRRLEENLKTINARKGRQYELSISYGIVRYDPSSQYTIDELISQADKIMYECKKRKTTLKFPAPVKS